MKQLKILLSVVTLSVVLFFQSCNNEDEVTLTDAPVAGFTAVPTTVEVGETVTFSDQSENTPVSWSWDFGDGNNSTDQNPTHTYTTEGTFNVSLTVTNNGGTDSFNKTITVTALGLSICSPGQEQDLGITGYMGKDNEGYLWYVKEDNKIYKKMINDDAEQLVGGSGTKSVEDGSISNPRKFTWHSDGYMVFFDQHDDKNYLRKVTTAGEISTLVILPGQGFDIAINSNKEIHVGYAESEIMTSISKLNSTNNSLESIPDLNDVANYFDFGPNNTLYYLGTDGIYTYANNQKTRFMETNIANPSDLDINNDEIIYVYHYDGVSRILQIANGVIKRFAYGVSLPIGMLVEKDGSGAYILQAASSSRNNSYIPCE